MEYISVAKAAELLGISERRIQQMCKKGEIPGAKKDGKRWIIPENTMQVFSVSTAKKRLPIGISDYRNAVTNYYYVDKTLLIRDFLDKRIQVSLFTRPRRFGKTLTMDMLRVFFEKTNEDTSVFFKDQAIWNCGRVYQKEQGKYPVIYLSFKDVKYDNWDNAFQNMTSLISTEFDRHRYLLDSTVCSDAEKRYFQKVIDKAADEVELAESLKTLSRMLTAYHGVAAIIMVDEYDTPIQEGFLAGYYDKVIGFIRNLFSGAFKDNSNLSFGFLTGILRVAKESIFSGMNNLKVYSITDELYSGYFGFTEAEVRQILDYYGFSGKFDELRMWYDGYRFGKTDIYNPWSVINYIDDNCHAKAFWQSTGSNDIIGEIISCATPDIMENLVKLLQGDAVTTFIDTSVIYPEIKTKPSSVYSFLLTTGYLKISQIHPQSDGNFMCKVAIPNKEIFLVYEKEIISRNPSGFSESSAIGIQEAIYQKDIAKLQKLLEKFMVESISFFDAANEAFYHGLMMGLCAIVNNRYYLRSNCESGFGRLDIQLEPRTKELPGFIFELKTQKDDYGLDSLAERALRQINEKQYEMEMKSRGIDKIVKIGVAFSGKQVVVVSENDE
ncbi:MAG: AAA family ATPase [Blautia sp.]|nr:AAA family ATPase [Blautia sp.]